MTTPAEDRAVLLAAMAKHLARSLGSSDDGGIILQLVEFLADNALNFGAPEGDPKAAQSIVVFSFGWRRLPNGKLEPGPINEELAALTDRLMQLNQTAAVYAQHEVGELLAAVQPNPVNIVYPTIDSQGNVEYLSTRGVWRKVIQRAKESGGLGSTVVLGHRLHVARVCRQGKDLGVHCYVPAPDLPPADFGLPTSFDPSKQNQPWCQSPLPFLVHSMINDMVFFRRATLGVEAPSIVED